MKVIFLDIDGVLNTYGTWQAEHTLLLPRCVNVLNRIIRETEAVLVLSSSWRYMILRGDMTVNGFYNLLQSHGVSGWLIAHTPECIEGEHGFCDRCDEIKEYLDAPWSHCKEKPIQTIESFLILDDDPDAFGGMPGIKIDGNVALSESNIDTAVYILGRKGRAHRYYWSVESFGCLTVYRSR